MPVYAAFSSHVARVDVESRAQVCAENALREVVCDLELQALKQLLLETDKRENQGLPKVNNSDAACGHSALWRLSPRRR
jgi:hypothetical protein